METLQLLRDAFSQVVSLRVPLAKALIFPLLALVLIEFAIAPVEDGIMPWVGSGVSLLLQVVVAITTHRVVLLGPAFVPVWGIRSWSMRESRFTLHALASLLVFAPIAALAYLEMLSGLIFLITIIVFIVLFARLALVFPGIAVDHKVSFQDSWNLTCGYGIEMFIIVFFFPLLLTIAASVLSSLLGGGFVVSFLMTIGVVVEIVVLSLAYQQIAHN